LETEGVLGALSQARRLDQADAMIREAISIVLDVPEDSFDVRITPDLEGELTQEVHRLAAARRDLEERGEEVRTTTARLARRLRDEGLPMGDIGALLGLSHQAVGAPTRALNRG